LEKTGIISDVVDSRPVLYYHTLAEYLVARWLCDNIQTSQTFLRDHLFESGLSVARSMVDRILANNCTLHEAVLNSNMRHVAKLLKRKESITQEDVGGRTPLHVAVSCRKPDIIKLLLEHGEDVSCEDTFLWLSPLEYANRMDDWQVLSLIMEKRPDIREQVLNEMIPGGSEYIASALRAAARHGHTDLLRYLIRGDIA
jgi:ankyrin repeat protein